MSTITNRYQDRHGAPRESSVQKVRDHLHPWVQEFIQNAPFAVLASADADGNCDASPKGGKPGFIKVLDERHLILPDVKGNRLFQSYENVDTNNHVGLLFMIPGLDQSARVNGSAEVVDLDTLADRGINLEVHDPDESAALQQGLLITVEEAYGQCPRALRFGSIWDTELIDSNRADPPVGSKPVGV